MDARFWFQLFVYEIRDMCVLIYRFLTKKGQWTTQPLEKS